MKQTNKNRFRIYNVCFLVAVLTTGVIISGCDHTKKTSIGSQENQTIASKYKRDNNTRHGVKKSPHNSKDVKIEEINQELQAVLHGKRSFYNTSNKKNEYIKCITIKSLLLMKKGKTYYDKVHFNIKKTKKEIIEWCKVDIDSDNEEEIVILYQGGIELVLDSGKKVCGYLFSDRNLKLTKRNGMFASSYSAAETFVRKMIIKNEKCFYEEICSFDGYKKQYEIKGKKVSKKAASNFIEDFYDTDEIKWYKYEY